MPIWSESVCVALSRFIPIFISFYRPRVGRWKHPKACCLYVDLLTSNAIYRGVLVTVMCFGINMSGRVCVCGVIKLKFPRLIHDWNCVGVASVKCCVRKFRGGVEWFRGAWWALIWKNIYFWRKCMLIVIMVVCRLYNVHWMIKFFWYYVKFLIAENLIT